MGAWSCTNCELPIAGRARPDHPGAEPIEWWPLTISEPALSDAIPASIAVDVREAHRCVDVQAYRAAVAMARRAIQAAAFEKGVPDDKQHQRLADQIDWLAAQGVIQPLLRDVANRIRLTGNDGAHPDRDGLRDVTETDANAALVFLRDFMIYVYELPHRLHALAPAESP